MNPTVFFDDGPVGDGTESSGRESDRRESDSLKVRFWPGRFDGSRFVALTVGLVLVFGEGACGRDESVPFDVDAGVDAGHVDAQPDVDVRIDGSGQCSDGATRCVGPDLQRCESGTFVLSEACTYGCSASPSPHCGQPVFSNGLLIGDMQAATASVDLGGNRYVIDTDSGQITGHGAPAPGTYTFRLIDRQDQELPSILVLSFANLRIHSGTRVTITGSRVLALAVRDTLSIEGILDVSAGPDGAPGSGGFAGGSDGGSGQGPGSGGAGLVGSLNVQEGGGGGGGFAVAGGAGGLAGTALGGRFGSPYGNPGLDPILGGSGGGSGAKADTASQPGAGGGGGGAVMLVSLGQVQVLSNGVIRAGGAGGRGGGSGDAGGGGGSGGAVLIVAPTVTILGIIAANGGGGGGADQDPPSDGQAGADTDQAAVGGTGGGNGSAGASLSGQDAPAADHHAGGGGGAAGRIRIESRDVPQLAGTISPDPGSHGVSIAALRVQ